MQIIEIIPRKADFKLRCEFGAEPAEYLAIIIERISGLEFRVPVCKVCSRLSESEILKEL